MAAVRVAALRLPVQWAVQRLANQTILFQRGEYIFATFGLFAGLAALVGGTFGAWFLLAGGASPWGVAALMAGILVGHLIPARAFLLPWRLSALRRQPGAVLRTVEFASWGGMLAIAVCLALYMALSGTPMLDLTDIAVRSGPLAHAIGRLGCLSFGCCFGRPTGLALAIRYDNPMAKAVRQAGFRDVPLHPVPVYEAAYNLALFGFLNVLAVGGAGQGIPTAAYLVLYGAGRFGLEAIRYKNDADRIGPLQRNQWLSLIMIVSGVVLLPFNGPSPAFETPSAWELIAIAPVLAGCSGIVFLAYSVHRGTLGRW
ncbi:MAG: prolipoprotein diacylglyceryl transferase [Dehalococcoidia bacterium]|nr:prolipoprotein diacylglyceryl transferase [Dehalococcoidia bacterium]